MQPDQWKKIRDIFEQAIDLPPEIRKAHLDEACGQDHVLRETVDKMLAAHLSAGEFLESAETDFLPILEDQAAQNALWIGRRVGAYRITDLIGEGGMGAVYLGQRDDQEFQARVAIKILRPGMATGPLLQRFRQERQTLAGLNHPNIARLLDGGTSEEGIPYLIMEYVDGIPIDRYCAEKNLDIESRLQLFLQVCEAVEHAHRNLIVHRDIKPANILVTEKGRPKLLDFGISRILTPEQAAERTQLSQAGLHWLTPEYASPEQVRDEAISTASDVYSLGVLLYLLLTGVLPYRFSSRTPGEIERVVCETIPTRPSGAIDEAPVAASANTPALPAIQGNPRRWRRRLRGDLDNIVLMALRKEPQRRYGSVEGFSTDIRRHLRGLPITARQDHLGYRFSRFVRRHRVGTVFSALLLLTVLAATAGIWWQSRIVRQQRDEANRQAARAQRVVEFLQNMLSAADPYESGRDVTVLEVLRQASRKLGKEMREDPAVKAEIYQTMARTYLELGSYDSALVNYQRCLDSNRKVFAGNSPQVIRAVNNLALTYHYQGKLSQADTLYQQALAALPQMQPRDENLRGEVINDFATLLTDMGDYQGAEELFRQALSLALLADSTNSQAVIVAKNNLAIVLRRENKLEEAESLYEDITSTLQQKVGKPTPDDAVIINNLARIKAARGKWEEAEKLYLKSLALHYQLYGERHPLIFNPLKNLGSLYLQRGRYEEAERYFRAAMEMLRSGHDEQHPDMAVAELELGKTLRAEGRENEAAVYLRRSANTRVAVFGEEHPETIVSKQELARCLMALGGFREAERLLLSIEHFRQQHPDDEDAYHQSLQDLIDLYSRWGKSEQEKFYRELEVRAGN